MQTVSVVIVTYNSERYLANCLESLKAQAHPLEIFLLDNASRDSTLSVARSYLPSDSILALDENVGFSRAVNVGIKRTQHENVLVMNPDIVLKSETVSRLLSTLNADSDVAAVGPKHRYPDGKLQLTWGEVPNLVTETVRKHRQYALRRGDPRTTSRFESIAKPLNVGWVAGSCILLRKAVNEAIGGWDENFFLFFEDIDWCLRAGQHGYRIVFDPTVSVQHEEGASATTNPHESSKAYRQSQLYFVDKHWGWFSRTVLKTYLWLKRRRGSRST